MYEVGGEAYKNGVVRLHFLVKVSFSKYVLFLLALDTRVDTLVCACVPFQAWIFKMVLPEDKVSLSLCVETSRTSAEYSAAVYEIPCPALPSVKIL